MTQPCIMTAKTPKAAIDAYRGMRDSVAVAYIAPWAAKFQLRWLFGDHWAGRFSGRAVTRRRLHVVGKPEHADAAEEDHADGPEAVVVGHHIGLAANDLADHLQRLVGGGRRLDAA